MVEVVITRIKQKNQNTKKKLFNNNRKKTTIIIIIISMSRSNELFIHILCSYSFPKRKKNLTIHLNETSNYVCIIRIPQNNFALIKFCISK